MSNIKFILYTLIFFLSITCLSLSVIYIYDPLQIFHKSYFKERFFSEMRLGARGIIKHYDFDSYILGTSMLQNTSAQEANEKLGGKWVNISPAGSSIKERSILLNYLFSHKEPKAIIYSLDAFSDELTTKPNFQLLYDNSFLNDFEAYFNDRFIICTLTFSQKESCIGEKNLETLLQWIKEEKHIQRLGGFENWIKFNSDIFKSEFKDFAQAKPVEFNEDKIDISKQQEFLNTFTLSFIKEHPNTKFHLVIPPYSRLHFKMHAKAFIERKRIISWLLHQTKNLNNVTIYGFDTLDYADNIANYAGDAIHYASDMNSLQLSAMRDKQYVLTLDNVESYFNTLEKNIKNYDITPLVNIAKNMGVINE
ncbi:hypothetical protein [uncultured Helicobacter sp.]|uniref:hypothetical protein n=1 Tax=uncultured Helicobacter sp. TaxID=175537 RepID=UPI002610DEFD|nr:hypothetical protein [uncultured Helicobacter sp.]